ncbi:hypothetical protein [Microlunatus parietis]|uniref:Cytoskeletal protein RodZ n=1 Tax=Microlunatus parietis TaxID=682979 RepID=A0A7Y9I4A8_9ACTN|nr:hypothetical protein [Microlunatus parietis]NYE69619.1 cytoskeletal protein RodZ [Microlunatus parietis]
MTLRRWSILVALAAALFTAACTGGTPTETEDSSVPSAPASSAAPSPSGPSSEAPSGPATSAAPSESPESSAPAGTEQTSEDGVFSWTMPCAAPQSQEITGNDMDELGIESTVAYTCGRLGDARITGAMTATLKQEPSAAEAKQLAEYVIGELAGSKPKLTDAELAGHPGWSAEVERGGRKIGLQAVWSGTAMALFFTTPPDDLPALLTTVQVKG